MCTLVYISVYVSILMCVFMHIQYHNLQHIYILTTKFDLFTFCSHYVYMIGDAHIYTNHITALQEQIKRIPKTFPKLYINKDITDIDGFAYSDLTIEGYTPDAAIKMDMAV